MSQGSEDIQQLINEVDDLVDAAREVQALDDEREAQRVLRQLQSAYHEWQEKARFLLPAALIETFDEQYESGLQDWRAPWRIARYLKDARMVPNPKYYHASAELPKWQAPVDQCFEEPIYEQKKLLLRAKVQAGRPSDVAALLDQYEAAMRRLRRMVGVLSRQGHDRRTGLAEPKDEYDVQKIAQAAFSLLAEDVDSEAWLDRSLGSTPRADFLLRIEGVAVEIKFFHDHTRKSRLGKDIKEDIAHYGADDRVRAMFFLIYDPKQLLENAPGFEADGYQVNSMKPVRVVVVQ